MHKISLQDFKRDLVFLKKIENENSWNRSDNLPASNPKRNRFKRHPKEISSDSEVSSPSADVSPRNRRPFSSVTQVKTMQEVDHNSSDDVQIDDQIPPFESEYMQQKYNKPSKLEQNSSPKMQQFHSFHHFNPHKNQFCKKVKTLIEKNIKVLSDIRQLINQGISPPDGEEDYQRKLRRVQGFSARFSRIYLYPTMRLTNELSHPDKLTSVAINQKIVSAYQIILQGLHAYYSHLPSSVGKCASDKLKGLLDQATYLCQIRGLLKKAVHGDNDEFIDAMRTHIELLEDVIKDINLTPEVDVRPRRLEQRSNTSTIRLNKKPKLQNRLTMYNVTASFRKDLVWKKAVESLAKKKFQVKSRYKTATFKHRPAVEKPHIIALPSKSKLGFRRSSGALKTTPLTTPVNEDDIKTMIEVNDNLQNPSGDTERLSHVDIAAKLLQLVRDKDRGVESNGATDDVDVNNEGVGSVAEVLRQNLQQHDLEEAFIEKVAVELRRRIAEEQSKLTFVEKQSSDDDVNRKEKKETIVSVTGAKNAKLICIRDDSSVTEEPEEDRADKEIMTDKEIVLASSATQTDLRKDKESTLKPKPGIKISRLPKSNLKTLEMLAKNHALNVIQYKLEYHRYRKQNPMYRRCCSIQPWVLMGKISDTILDDILLSVVKELEVNDILETMYGAEFQY